MSTDGISNLGSHSVPAGPNETDKALSLPNKTQAQKDNEFKKRNLEGSSVKASFLPQIKQEFNQAIEKHNIPLVRQILSDEIWKTEELQIDRLDYMPKEIYYLIKDHLPEA